MTMIEHWTSHVANQMIMIEHWTSHLANQMIMMEHWASQVANQNRDSFNRLQIYAGPRSLRSTDNYYCSPLFWWDSFNRLQIYTGPSSLRSTDSYYNSHLSARVEWVFHRATGYNEMRPWLLERRKKREEEKKKKIVWETGAVEGTRYVTSRCKLLKTLNLELERILGA